KAHSNGTAKPNGVLSLATPGGDHWTVVRGLLPLVWPADRADLRLKVVLAIAVLVAAKLVTIAVPILFKEATDWLTADLAKSGTEGVVKGLAIGAGALILIYGIARVLMMVLNQVRDVLFTRVGQNAVRQLNKRVFEHLHRLSLR